MPRLNNITRNGLENIRETVDSPCTDAFAAFWNNNLALKPLQIRNRLCTGVFEGGLMETDFSHDHHGINITIRKPPGNLGIIKLDFDKRRAVIEQLEFSQFRQGIGLGKTILLNIARIAHENGLYGLELCAAMRIGGYAWAKFGFLPDQAEWDNLRRMQLQLRFEDIEKHMPLDAAEQVRRAIASPDPKSLWLIAAISMPMKNDPDLTVGKATLFRTFWSGGLRFNDDEQRKVFEAYTGGRIASFKKAKKLGWEPAP